MANRRTADGITELGISGEEKQRYGCIVVYTDGTMKHFRGRNYLQQAADFADQLEVGISVMSTPATIFRDMQGTRRPFTAKKRQLADILHLPETALLAQIKRNDLHDRI